MHIPPSPAQGPILSWEPSLQGAALRAALNPEAWPLQASLLPQDAHLVGGAVRDALLGRLKPRPDLDLVVAGDAVALARQLAQRCGGSCVVLDAERSIARLVLQGWCFDLARRMGENLLQDLRRRDYSINAIALPLLGDGGPIDPCGGLEDLRRGELRALGEANLQADPLRLLRGVRLACELGFRLEPQTLRWIQQQRQRLRAVAGERVLAELEKLASAPAGAAGLAQTLELGLLEGWQGEGRQALPLLQVLHPAAARANGLEPKEAAVALPLARLAALLGTESLLALRASRRLQQRITRLRRWRDRLLGLSGSARALPGALAGLPEGQRLALHRELPEDLPALALHLDPSEAIPSLRRWRDPTDGLFHPRAPLDGASLMRELGLAAGPPLGELLAHLSAERAFGRLAEGPQAALVAARRWLASRQERSRPGGPADGPMT